MLKAKSRSPYLSACVDFFAATSAGNTAGAAKALAELVGLSGCQPPPLTAHELRGQVAGRFASIPCTHKGKRVRLAPNSGARTDIPVTFGNERGLASASGASSPMRIAIGLDGMR
jgi:hypothetical protein